MEKVLVLITTSGLAINLCGILYFIKLVLFHF